LYYLYIWFDNQILTLVFNPNFFCVKWLSLVDMNTSTAANAKVLSNNSKKSSLFGMLGMGNAAPTNAAAANAAAANNSSRATMAGGRRRASRKTRKASKKSRKASKKSRKMSRKASKKSRKSRK
jgi:hypothetical protein